MGRIRTGLHSSQLRGTLEERAALASRYGYAGVDLSLADAQKTGDPDAVRAIFSRYGVEPSSIGGVFAEPLFVGDDRFAASLQQAPQNARAAAAYGATRTKIVLWGRAHEPKEQLRPRIVERLRRMDEALDGSGVRLGLEWVGVRTRHADRPYPFVQPMTDAIDLLAEVQPRNLGLTLDSFHWYAGGDSLDTIRRTPGKQIVMLHLSDAPGGPRERLRDEDRLIPGEGVIPLADWLRAIDATGFEGFAAMELLRPPLADSDPETGARQAMDALRAVFAAADLREVAAIR